MILKTSADTAVGVLDASPAGVKHSASIDLEVALADNGASTVSDLPYIQMCNKIGQELDTTKVEYQLCRRIRAVRTHCCTTATITRGLQRLAANVALRLGFCWRHTMRGFLSQARGERERAFKHVKRARCDGFASIVGRYAND